MVDFTERLPLTNGTNRVIEDPAGPSALNTALQFASSGLDTFLKVKDDLAREKAARKKQEDEAAKLSAQNQTIGALFGAQDDVVAAQQARMAGVQAQRMMELQGSEMVQGASMDLPDYQLDEKTGQVFEAGRMAVENPAVIKTAERASVELGNIIAAVDQGRMPQITLETALNGRIRKLFEENPDQTEVILDILKKTPGAEIVFQKLEDVADWNDFSRERDQTAITENDKLEQKHYESGLVILGDLAAIGGANGGPMTRQEIIQHGLRHSRMSVELDMSTRSANLRLQNAQITASERKEIEGDRNQELFRILTGDFAGDLAPYTQAAQSLAGFIVGDPSGQNLKRWEEMGVTAKAAAGNWINNSINAAIQNGYTGDVAQLRTQLENQVKPFLDLFSGDFSVAQANQRALDSIKTNMGINIQQSLPMFSALKSAGLKPEEMPALMAGIQGNPKLQEQLKNEIKGFNTDFGQERASTRLMNIVKVLRGEATLREFSPAEARAALPSLYAVNLASAKEYGRGITDNPDPFLNSLGEITLATRTLTPGSGSGAHGVAAAGIGDPNVRAALKRAARDPNTDKLEVTATAQAVRAGAAQILNNVQVNMVGINRTSNLFQVKWDNANGRYVIDNSKQRAAVAAAQRGGNRGRESGLDARFSGMADRQAAGNFAGATPPDEMERWVKSANLSLDTIIDLGSIDPTTPKGTELELRRYYGNNQPLKADQGDLQIVPQKEANRLFEVLERGLPQIKPDIPEVAPAKTSSRSKGKPRNFQAEAKSAGLEEPIRQTASKYGIPEEIAFALIGSESSFRPGIEGIIIDDPKSEHYGDRAIGLGQVMRKTAAAYGVTDRRKLTPQQELDLAFRYLSDLKKNNKGETWEDAVSRYFSGRNLRRAVAEGANDKLTDVLSYVRGIVR